jgi:dihydroorotate dehydrogenase
MGFNNHGAAAAAARLRSRRSRRSRRRSGVMVGVNIGKTRAAPESGAAADYAASARLLGGVAGYLVVNVSSPNTPGLRDLQAADRLRPLLAAVSDALEAAAETSGRTRNGTGQRIPLLVKISPDLADADIDAIADLAIDLGLDGIVATNTTVSRDHTSSDPAEVDAAGPGGLSGPPLKQRALEVLQRLHTRTGGRLTLVAVGGIETADDAWERIRAGATLLQAYTGFVYGGPLWPRSVQAGLARRVREAGFTSVQQAVGTAVASRPCTSAAEGQARGGGRESRGADRA